MPAAAASIAAAPTPAPAAIVDTFAFDREAVVTALAALERDLFGPGAWSEAAVRQELDAPARTYLLALDGAEPGGGTVTAPPAKSSPSSTELPPLAGYAGFWYDGDDAEVMTIGVDRAHQGRGLGTRLMEGLVDRARAQGARRVLLEVRVDNGPALALYQRLGFTRLGLRKRYYQPGGIDAYTMALDLGPRVVGFAPASAANGRREP